MKIELTRKEALALYQVHKNPNFVHVNDLVTSIKTIDRIGKLLTKGGK